MEKDFNLFVRLWYADDGMLVGKIDQVKKALFIIAEYSATINFIVNPTNKKAFWQNQHPSLLAPLADAYKLYLKSTSEGNKILGVPIRSQSLFSTFINNEINDIDK